MEQCFTCLVCSSLCIKVPHPNPSALTGVGRGEGGKSRAYDERNLRLLLWNKVRSKKSHKPAFFDNLKESILKKRLIKVDSLSVDQSFDFIKKFDFFPNGIA